MQNCYSTATHQSLQFIMVFVVITVVADIVIMVVNTAVLTVFVIT